MSTDVDNYLAHIGVEVDTELKHFGKKGMKWGVRKEAPATLTARDTDTEVTKKAKADYNNLNDQQFSNKYGGVSKKTYAKRVAKNSDPYAANNSQKNRDIYEARDRQTERGLDLQRQAFKTYAANGEKAANASLNKYNKMEKEALEHPDAATAAKMTSGEKAVTAISWGLVGLALAATVAAGMSDNR